MNKLGYSITSSARRSSSELIFAEREVMECDALAGGHSALMLAARITLPHFSVSSANSLPNSVGVIGIGTLPRSTMRALILGSARPALISRLSFSTISSGIPFGAATPLHVLAS
jgi:hypothetical protein